jgi:hypothetical protein
MSKQMYFGASLIYHFCNIVSMYKIVAVQGMYQSCIKLLLKHLVILGITFVILQALYCSML